MLEHDRVALLGACTSLGQTKSGVEETPDRVRESGFLASLELQGFAVQDRGNVRAGTQAGSFLRRLSDETRNMARTGAFSVIVGGDHSLSIGSITGLHSVHPDLAVVWVDAHGDMNTPETSPTGSLHGMPVAALLGETRLEHQKGFSWLQPSLSPDRFALLGARCLDPGEEDLIRRLDLPVARMQDVHKQGVEACLLQLLRRIDPLGRRPLHLSFDIDALSPEEAPATGVPVKNGLSLSDALHLVRFLASTRRLVSMELVEINLHQATSPLSAWRTLEAGQILIQSAIERRVRPFRVRVGEWNFSTAGHGIWPGSY